MKLKPYLWMVDYTPQREWIDAKGLFLLTAFYFAEIGAGLYLVSLFFKFWLGCLLGWLISVALGGGLHLLYLGKPFRVWQAVLRPAKSELSRGMIVMILFTIVGAIQLAPSIRFLSGLPWGADSMLLTVTMAVLSFLVVVHGFVTMNLVSAIPFWNSAILPVLSLASGLWVGTQLGMGTDIAFSGKEIIYSMEPLARFSLFSYGFLLVCYFWNASHSSLIVRRSLRVIFRGNLSLCFYIGVIFIGLFIPLFITLQFWTNDVNMNPTLLSLRVVCALIGDLMLRYIISKEGRYAPLIYSNIVQAKDLAR